MKTRLPAGSTILKSSTLVCSLGIILSAVAADSWASCTVEIIAQNHCKAWSSLGTSPPTLLIDQFCWGNQTASCKCTSNGSTDSATGDCSKTIRIPTGGLGG